MIVNLSRKFEVKTQSMVEILWIDDQWIDYETWLHEIPQIEVYSFKHLKPHQVNEVQMIVNLSRKYEVKTRV